MISRSCRGQRPLPCRSGRRVPRMSRSAVSPRSRPGATSSLTEQPDFSRVRAQSRSARFREMGRSAHTRRPRLGRPAPARRARPDLPSVYRGRNGLANPGEGEMIKPGITAVAAGAILAVVVSACGSSGPANATSILQSDGYTPSSVIESSMASSLGSSSGVSSSAAGTDNAGKIQLVLVFTDSGTASIGAAGVRSAATGIAVTVNGDIVTATGPAAAWANAGS